jgi:hypothetical protein
MVCSHVLYFIGDQRVATVRYSFLGWPMRIGIFSGHDSEFIYALQSFFILTKHQYLITSWYTKAERGKRVALFYCTAALASMFSGYLQAGAYSGLDGVSGRAGWQASSFSEKQKLANRCSGSSSYAASYLSRLRS